MQAPLGDHPRLYPGAEIPPLPVALRTKPWIDSFFIPLFPAAKVHYFGEKRWLGLFRDLSRVALAALRENLPDVDALVDKVLYVAPPRDADPILADLCLLLLRDAIGCASRRKSLMDRWLWGDTARTTRVPYYSDEREAWKLGSPGAAVPEIAPDVTTFYDDVFNVSVAALDVVIRAIIPTKTKFEPLRTEGGLPEKLLENPGEAKLSVARGHARQFQSRILAHLDSDPPFISLDGEPFPPFLEAATYYVARLIEANGEQVSFANWLKGHEEFLGTKVVLLSRGVEFV